MDVKRVWLTSASLVSLLPAAASAEWTGKGETGVAFSRGNTETDTANVKLDMASELEVWKFAFGGAGMYASDNEGPTGQRWDVHAQSDRKFGERNFWFGGGRYEEDRFSGFIFQATLSTGVGRKFIDTEPTQFTAQLGVGYKVFETRDALAEDGVTMMTGERNTGAAAIGSADFRHQLTGTTTLLDKLTVESSEENTFVQNDLSLQVKITDVLALALGYSLRHNTDPPAGFRRTDTLTTVNLVYEIK